MFRGTSNHRFWRTAVAVFGLMVLIDYAPIFSGKIPFPSDEVLRHSAWNGQPRQQLPELIDIVAFIYPFRALLSRAADERTVPLWNPYTMSGAPAQANAQSSPFAPLNIVYYVLPLKVAWAANLLVRLFLAAVFMAMFVRSIGGSDTGALVSGIVFSLSGFVTVWQGQAIGDSAIWLPLMCYAVHRLHRKRNAFSIAIAAFAFAMPLLGGHPETAAHSALATCAWAAFLVFTAPPGESADRSKSEERRLKARFAFGFVLAGLLAVGLASVQSIPTLEWFGQLGLHVDAPQPVLDRHQGQGIFSRDITRNPSSAGVWIPEASAYVGMLGLLAAFLAPFHQSRRYVYFLVGITIVAGVVAYGVQPARWIVVHLPLIKAMKNGRLTLVMDFALSALAGLGISAIGEQFARRGRQMRRHAMALMCAAFIVISFGISEVKRATLTPVELSRSSSASLVFLAAALVLIAARLGLLLNGRSFSLLVCGLTGLEMLSFSYGYLRFAPMREVFPSAPVLDFIQGLDHSAPFRVAKDRVPIPHNAGMIYGFEAADGYDLTTLRTRLFTSDLTENREDGVMFLAENILAAHDRRFDMLNVKYLMLSKPGAQFDTVSASGRFAPVFSQASVAVFENKTALPRFFSVPLSGIEVIHETSAQATRLKEESFDPEKSVIFSDMPAEVRATPSNPGTVKTDIEIVGKGMNAYRLLVDSREQSVLVVSQIYYPGWRATVDGAEIPVYPVNVALTALVVPSGLHDVRLFFLPASFQIGLAISLACLGITGLLFFRGE